MINLILNILQKSNALEISFIDISKKNMYSKYVIIATGTSLVHIQSIVKNIIKFTKNSKVDVITISGLKTEWILIDLDLIIIHIMSKYIRQYYQLEEIYN